jgi:hypothetical protein
VIEIAVTVLIGAMLGFGCLVWLTHRDIGRALVRMDRSVVACERAAEAATRAADGATRAAEAARDIALAIRDWVGQSPAHKRTPAE